jgi:hypothetical protein
MVTACAEMYKESGCRQAYLAAASPTVSVSAKLGLMIEGCRDAYCPVLAAPKPPMCGMSPDDIRSMKMAAKGAAWAELQGAILAHDYDRETIERLKRGISAPDTRLRVILGSNGSDLTVQWSGGFITVRLVDGRMKPEVIGAIRDHLTPEGVVLERPSGSSATDVSRATDLIKSAGGLVAEVDDACPPAGSPINP